MSDCRNCDSKYAHRHINNGLCNDCYNLAKAEFEESYEIESRDYENICAHKRCDRKVSWKGNFCPEHDYS